MDEIGPSQNKVIFKHFRDSGDSVEMNVDGSVTPVNFRFTNSSTNTAHIVRVLFVIKDGSITPVKFGGIAELTNGLLISMFDDEDNEVVDFLDGTPIKSNVEFSNIAGSDVAIGDFGVSDAVSIRWTLSKAGGAIGLPPGYYMQIKVQDDLTGLGFFRTTVQGYYG